MFKVFFLLFVSGVLSKSVHRTDEIHLDWRAKDVVLPVPDEDKCIHTSIINSLDLVSSMSKLQTGSSLVKLSRQQVYDCYNDVGQKWCPCGKAGNITQVLKVLHLNHLTLGDVDTLPGNMGFADSYPYTGQCSTKCKYSVEDNDNGVNVAILTRTWGDVNGKSYETEYEEHLKKGPFVVSINACEDFRNYEEGILDTNKCNGELNHSLLVVGYGTITTYSGYKNHEHGVKQGYWIARNSWGIGWGEEGYVRIARDKNVCRIGESFARIAQMDNYDPKLVETDGTLKY